MHDKKNTLENHFHTNLKMSLYYHKGDLFETDTKCLAHCVSQDFNMGAGIAKIFKDRFGRQNELIASNPNIGDVVLILDKDTYVFYLVTKDKYYNKPTIESLTECLIKLATMMTANKITEIAIPKIGCGLDKLKWHDVEQIITNTLVQKSINVHVYTL